MNVKWLKMKVSFGHFIGKVKSAAGNQLQWKSGRSSRGRKVVAVSCTTHSFTPGGAQDPILKSSSGNVAHAAQMIHPASPRSVHFIEPTGDSAVPLSLC